MKISVAMIVLNEAENIGRALQSCDFADEIVIVDGGSTDGTLQRVAQYEDQTKLKVVRHPWENDFGRQRNVSFKECTGDWIIRLDADEIFGIRLRSSISLFLAELPQECLSIRIRQNNLIEDVHHYSAALGGWETHPRAFRNTGQLNWNGQVHEWVEGVNHACADWNTCVIHFGWLDTDKMKQKERNYMNMPGSGFYEEGSLTGRKHEVRLLPQGLY